MSSQRIPPETAPRLTSAYAERMKQFAHEPDARRYVLRIAGTTVAVADYSINGNQISFHHTFTHPAYRNRGHAAEVVAFAVDDVARNTSFRVVPMCWFVADWFAANGDRAELLSRSACRDRHVAQQLA